MMTTKVIYPVRSTYFIVEWVGNFKGSMVYKRSCRKELYSNLQQDYDPCSRSPGLVVKGCDS